MKKSFLVLFLVALTSSAFAGSVGQVDGKMEDCAMINNGSGQEYVAPVTPIESSEIINSTNK